MSGVSLSLGGAKKRPVAAAAFGEEPEERGSATAEIRDLEDGRSKAPRVISMKDTGGWHKGRLGKGSNAAAIMEHVKKGGTVTADDDQAGKKAPGMLGSHAGGAGAENDARAALMRDAARAAEQAEGEEQTLGLTIEGTTDKASAAERVKAAAARRKEQEDKIAFEDCGEETKLADYDEMPIAEFGMALMRGMGWKDGSALGSSRKGILEPVEIKAQPEGLGLGAVPSENEDAGGRGKGGRRFIPKPGQEKDHREEARERIRKEAAARMGTFQVGMEVAIVSGRHRGLTGKISYSYAHEIMVKLSASGEEVTVDKKDLDSDVSKARDIKTREQEQAERDKELRHRRHEEEQAQARGRSRANGNRDRDGGGDRGSDRASGRADPNEASSSRGAWLRPHIRVRIVDKGLKSGKYYLKKCRVVDVVGRGVCTVLVEDDRRLLEDVSYKMLETVLPKTGGRVMIVGGSKELCGRRGCLVRKNKDTEEASVQLAGQDLRIETVSMDHIAEFVGEAEDLLED